jgi:hypothetical protein
MALEPVLGPVKTEAVLAASCGLAIEPPAWWIVVLVMSKEELALEAIMQISAGPIGELAGK